MGEVAGATGSFLPMVISKKKIREALMVVLNVDSNWVQMQKQCNFYHVCIHFLTLTSERQLCFLLGTYTVHTSVSVFICLHWWSNEQCRILEKQNYYFWLLLDRSECAKIMPKTETSLKCFLITFYGILRPVTSIFKDHSISGHEKLHFPIVFRG